MLRRGLSLVIVVTSVVFSTIGCENNQLCRGLPEDGRATCLSCARGVRDPSITEPFPPKQRDLNCEAALEANMLPKVAPNPVVPPVGAPDETNPPQVVVSSAPGESNVLSEVWQKFGEAPEPVAIEEDPQPTQQFEGAWSGQGIEHMVVLGDSLGVGLFSDTVLWKNPPHDQVLDFLSILLESLPGDDAPVVMLPEVDMFYREESLGALVSNAPYSISHRLGVADPINLAFSGAVVDDVSLLAVEGLPELVAADLVAVSVGTNDFCAYGDSPDFQARYLESYRTLLVALNGLGRRPVVLLKPILSPVTIYNRVAEEPLFNEDIQVAISVMLGRLGTLGVDIPPYAFTLRDHADATCRQVIQRSCPVIGRNPNSLGALQQTVVSANQAVADLIEALQNDELIKDRFIFDFDCPENAPCRSEINRQATELPDIKPYLALDCFHLSSRGHELVADVLFEKLAASRAVRVRPETPSENPAENLK